MADEEREAAILARCEAATKGPWGEDDGCVFSVPLSEQRVEAIRRRLDGEDIAHPDDGLAEAFGFVCNVGQEQPNYDSDAAFIAHARADVPWLLDQLTALRARAERAEGALAEMELVVRWALGQSGEFRTRGENEGPFWWRTELRQRLCAALAARGE